MDQAMPPREGVEQTTALALEEKSKLVKSLRRFDMVFFTICAFVGLDTLGTVASNGGQGFTWLVVLALLFVLPYGLLMSEVGSAFTQEGGPYEWAKMAFGRMQGGISAVLYWVTNPLWVGGSLAFIAEEAWNDNLFHIAPGKGGETHQTAEGKVPVLTTQQGVPVADDQNTLRAGPRGPALLEDFHFREKLTRFDHERIPERVVHARGSGAHGFF